MIHELFDESGMEVEFDNGEKVTMSELDAQDTAKSRNTVSTIRSAVDIDRWNKIKMSSGVCSSDLTTWYNNCHKWSVHCL